jgi:hypothetical protein
VCRQQIYFNAELTEDYASQGCIKLTILSLGGTRGERTEERGNQ